MAVYGLTCAESIGEWNLVLCILQLHLEAWLCRFDCLRMLLQHKMTDEQFYSLCQSISTCNASLQLRYGNTVFTPNNHVNLHINQYMTIHVHLQERMTFGPEFSHEIWKTETQHFNGKSQLKLAIGKYLVDKIVIEDKVTRPYIASTKVVIYTCLECSADRASCSNSISR